MKRLSVVILAVVLASVMGSCAVNTAVEPSLNQLRSICNLATLKCYYHNVAKSVKDKNSGIAGFGEVEREFWIEYEGYVKIGIDMSLVSMEVKGTQVKVTLPEAKVLDIGIDNESWNDSSYIHSGDSWFNKNKITADDQNNAIAHAQETMKEEAQNNKQLLDTARSKAQQLIENYINQLGKMAGVEYEITWIYTEDPAR